MASIIRTTDEVAEFIQLNLDTTGDTFLLAQGVQLVSTVGGFLSASAQGVKTYFDGYFYIGNFGQSVYLQGNDIVEIGAGARLLLGSRAEYLGIQLGNGASGPAIDPVGGTTVTNRGEISVPNGGGVGVAGGSNRLVNDGTITAASNAVELGRFGGAADTLLNRGTITATGGLGASILGHGVTLAGTGAVVSNEGAISALATNKAAIRIFVGFNDITNSGELTALRGYGILDTSTDGSTIVNTGTISGVLGAVSASSGADTLTNRGLLDGDVLLGAGNDRFDGRGGEVAGTVSGGAGDDTFLISDPDTVLSELALGGTDAVIASGSFTLGTNLENLRLAGAADSFGTGNEAANVIEGNGGSNRLAGLGGNDTLTGAGGNDTIEAGRGDDSADGGTGEDRLLGRSGLDTLAGGAGEDHLAGGAGDDSIQGGDDDDILLGGSGRDRLQGGADADTFEFRFASDSGAGTGLRDIVVDFEPGLDRIDLSAIDARPGTAGNQAFTFLGTGAFTGAEGQLRVAGGGANIVLEADLDGNGGADMQIQVNGLAAFALADLVL